MGDILQRLGKRIREIRIQRGFSSQDAFATYVGLHRAFVGHLETGRKDFRLSTLVRVADALGVTLSDLFAGLEDGESPRPKVFGQRTENDAERAQFDWRRILKEVANLERAARAVKELALEAGTVVPDGREDELRKREAVTRKKPTRRTRN